MSQKELSQVEKKTRRNRHSLAKRGRHNLKVELQRALLEREVES